MRIFTDEHEKTLIIPRSALFRSPAGKWQLFLVRNRHVALQTVAIGLINDWLVEISDGIREGDIVILAPDSKLQPGDLVTPTVR